jgi:uncharacterized membrane protein
MAISCPQCATQMPDAAAFCPGCGRRMIVAPAAVGATGPFTENVAGALAYFTVMPAIVFLSVKQFKRNQFVRFHSFQSLFLTLAIVVAAIALRFLFLGLALIPRVGYLLGWLLVLLTALAVLMLWLVLMVKALQGDRFKLPMLGEFAERA